MMKKLFLLLVFLPFMGFSNLNEQKTPIETTELAPSLYRVFINNAVAVVVSVGADGVLLVDAGYERTANDLIETLKSLSTDPIGFIVNTHIHGDHTGGNLVLGKNVDIISHVNVKTYLSQEKQQGDRLIPAFPAHALPNITFTDRMNIDYNDESLELIHLPNGHTGGDVIVFFKKSNVLVVGDLLFANYFPYVDVGNGGNPFNYLKNIDWITNNFPADAKVVGGHGPVYTIEQYREYRNVLQQTITVVESNKQDGMSVDQMKETRILKEWESFGKFFITEDRWIDTVFPFF